MYDKNLRSNRTSFLYHLQPIGVGTPYVEGLKSYIKRLAEAHHVTLGNLLTKEIVPGINKYYLKTNHIIEHNSKIDINALSSDINKAIVRVLEEKTCNDCLAYLTMSSWEDFFYSRYMFRKKQAWCPICYEERLQLGQPIYEQLIWSVNDVEICRRHKARLMKKCPYCGREFSGFNSTSRVGYCDYCKAWLGLEKYENSQITSTEEEWNNWVYDNIGQLLTVAPMIKEADNLFSHNVKKILDSINTSQREFERQIKLSHTNIHTWLSGAKPILTNVLRLSYKFEYPITELLTKDINMPINEINNKKIIPQKKSVNSINIDELKTIVNEAIDSKKGLSLIKLTTITGVSADTLKKYFPDEVIKLKQNYIKYLEECKLAQFKLIKETMKSILHRGIFPSRKAISHELGKRTVTNDDERKVWLETLEELGCTNDIFYNGSRK